MPGDGVFADGDLAADLARFADRIPDAVNAAFRNEANGIERAAQARALTINLRGGRRGTEDTGLRRALASAIGVQFENEKVTFIVRRSGMPAGKGAMPVVSAMRTWRHPVYGNRNVWVTQTGQTSWFGRAVFNEAIRTLPPEIERQLRELTR